MFAVYRHLLIVPYGENAFWAAVEIFEYDTTTCHCAKLEVRLNKADKMPKLVVSDGTSEKYDSKDERTILLRYWQGDVPVADMLTLAPNPRNWVLTT